MKKYPIWKSWYLFTKEEEKDFREDALESYLETHDVEYGSEEWEEEYAKDFDDYCISGNESYLETEFGENWSNYSCSPLKNVKVAVIGNLGLWDGSHKIYPKEFENLNKAVYACLEDYNEIYEDQYGNLHIEAHHHDGCNHFIIKKVTPKGLRTLNFRKEAYGC